MINLIFSLMLSFGFSSWAEDSLLQIDAFAKRGSHLLVVASRSGDETESYFSVYDPQSGKVISTTKLKVDSTVVALEPMDNGMIMVASQDVSVPPGPVGVTILDEKSGAILAEAKSNCESYDQFEISAEDAKIRCEKDDPKTGDTKSKFESFPFDKKLKFNKMSGVKPLRKSVKIARTEFSMVGDYPWIEIAVKNGPTKSLKAEQFIGK